MKDLIVIKIGGSTFKSRDTTIEDIVTLQQRGQPLVIVHGGGNVVTDWLAKQGVAARFVRGERITDSETLPVVVAVLAGLANKEIVSAINVRGGKAVGICGADGSMVQCRMREEELGYVGSVVKIDTALIESLLAAGFVPVISPLCLHSYDRPADAPNLLNVNGDILTGELAAALGAGKIIFLTDVPGVRDGSGNIIEKLSVAEAESAIASGVASGGMIPKINASLKALTGTPVTRIIDGRESHALVKEIDGQGGGTTIYRK